MTMKINRSALDQIVVALCNGKGISIDDFYRHPDNDALGLQELKHTEERLLLQAAQFLTGDSPEMIGGVSQNMQVSVTNAANVEMIDHSERDIDRSTLVIVTILMDDEKYEITVPQEDWQDALFTMTEDCPDEGHYDGIPILN